ncbi:MAG: flavodoxin family protein [Xanthomonadales bacterium]|nr:flavodoxin family protein [Xanthomonadales bacterium]
MTKGRLLIVAHQPSENTRRLASVACSAVAELGLPSVAARLLKPAEAGANEVLESDGVLLGTTENFGYMAGALKDFFERIYYPCLDHTRGRPYALWVRAGNDGQGARTSVERIIQGLGWRAVQPPLILCGEWRDEFTGQVAELSQTLAAGLDAGIY